MASSTITVLHLVLQIASLDLLSPTQVCELTLSSGALNDTNQINLVFDRLETGEAIQNVEEFLTALAEAPKASRSVKTPGLVEAAWISPRYVAYLKCLSHSWCFVPAGS